MGQQKAARAADSKRRGRIQDFLASTGSGSSVRHNDTCLKEVVYMHHDDTHEASLKVFLGQSTVAADYERGRGNGRMRCTPTLSSASRNALKENARMHQQSASTSLLNFSSCGFDSPFHPRQLLEQLDSDEFDASNQSVALSGPPSVSALVHMIRNHESCKEVIQSVLPDKQCLSHVQDHFAMNLPIAVQASYNHSNIDWSKCVKPYPVDKHAFHFYSCGSHINQPRLGKKSGSQLE